MSGKESGAAPAKGPSHIAYSVRESKEGQAYFNRVGSAFAHKDGQGFNIELDATPVNGRITLRTPKDRLDAKREGKDRSNPNHDRERGQ